MEKITIPSKKQVFRLYDEKDIMTGDVIDLAEKDALEEGLVYDPLNPMRYYKVSNPSKIESLLKLKVQNGKIIEKLGDWREARKTMEKDINLLSVDSKRLLEPKQYKVSISKTLYDLRTHLIESHVSKKIWKEQ